MVTVVSTYDASAYLSHVKGGGGALPAQIGTTTGTTTSSSSSSSSTSTTTPTSTSNTLGLSSAILSLLQSTSANSKASSGGLDLSGLLGGSNSNDSNGIYGTLLYNASQVKPLQDALAKASQPAVPQVNPLTSILSSRNVGVNAYNKTLQQNAAAVVASNSFGPDGKTKLII